MRRLKRRLGHYPQLYSQIDSPTSTGPLSADECTFVLEKHWNRLGLALGADDFTDTEAVAAAQQCEHQVQLRVRRLAPPA